VLFIFTLHLQRQHKSVAIYDADKVIDESREEADIDWADD